MFTSSSGAADGAQVGSLAQRLGRWMPVIGGVVKPCAWGPGRSLRGAVSLNGDIHDHGAVGLVLTGEQLQVMEQSWGLGWRLWRIAWL